MSNMPDKPETWALVLAWLSQHAPVLYATGLSFVMAAIRIIYGGGTRRQAILEGAICGCLTVTLISGLEFFGLPQSLSTFVGGWVGFLGVEKIRALADRYANFKLPSSRAGE
ncbi:TPA: phage holin, lambda family [Pseudomonas aeruginosa]